MLLDLWPTLEACWGADCCAPAPPSSALGGLVLEGTRHRVPPPDTDEDILAALGLFGPRL